MDISAYADLDFIRKEKESLTELWWKVCVFEKKTFFMKKQVNFLILFLFFVFPSAAWQEKISNLSTTYDEEFKCHKCAPGCLFCKDSSPCLAFYNWPFRYVSFFIIFFKNQRLVTNKLVISLCLK